MILAVHLAFGYLQTVVTGKLGMYVSGASMSFRWSNLDTMFF